MLNYQVQKHPFEETDYNMLKKRFAVNTGLNSTEIDTIGASPTKPLNNPINYTHFFEDQPDAEHITIKHSEKQVQKMKKKN